VTFRVVSPSAEMTFPSANKPQLIEMPSFARSPVAPVRFSLSDPAWGRFDGSVSAVIYRHNIKSGNFKLKIVYLWLCQ
jgi:hypothetical protein